MLEGKGNRWSDYIHKIGKIGLIMLLMLPNMLINPVSEVFADEADYDILVDGETVTIVKYLGTDTDVNIPDQIQEKDVTAIADGAFSGKVLDTLTIPGTVTTIGFGAFMGCQLESLILNEGLIDIGLMAFAGNRMAHVDIPGTVTTIGAGAFTQGSLSTVTLHEGLETIGDQAFWSNELTSIIIPEGVTTIGEKAFILNKLEEVTLPGTITSMGQQAFLGGVEGENNIRTLSMQEGLSSIGESAFQDNMLETVQIPGSVLEIPSGAFTGNELESVSLHEGTEQIHMNAFAQNKLKNVEFPATLKQIGIMAFYQNEIGALTLPNSVEAVGDAAFGFNPLTVVKVYSDHVSFGMLPFFSDSTGPQNSITLFGRSGSSTEAYVQAMIELQLENDPESEEFLFSFQELEDGEPYVCGVNTDFECVVNDDDTITITGYTGSDTEVLIPETVDGKAVTAIGEEAFTGKQLITVELPYGVTIIGKQAFSANDLTSVTIINDHASIEGSAFEGNQTNPADLTIYGCFGSTAQAHANDQGYSFQESSKAECLEISLTPSETNPTNQDVLISVSVNKLSESIRELKWAEGEQNLAYFQGGGGELVTSNEFTVSENNTYTVYVEDVLGRELITTITIDNIDKMPPVVTGVTNGEVYAEPVTISFNEGTATLNGIAFTSGTTLEVNGEYELTVTDEAGNETNVMFEMKQSDYIYVNNGSDTVRITGYRGTDTRIEIPNTLDGKTVAAIGNYAFREKNLEHVIIPDSVTSIGDYAFYKNELQEIEIPSSVKTIGKHAFSENHLAFVTFSEGLETIGINAFYNNHITELAIPDTVTLIDYGAFLQNNITELTLGENIQTIAAFAFWSNNLQAVIIPESVQSIGESAFQHNQIREFTVLGNEVALDQKVLHDQNPENPELVLIHGYCGSTANELAMYWGYSFEQFEANECLAITLTPSGSEPTNEDVTVVIDVISDVANVVELKWAKGEQILAYFQDGGGDPVTSYEFTVSENDTYTAYVKDAFGRELIVTILINNIDKTPPIVTGVTDGEEYDEPVTISFNEGTATLNEIAFTSGTTVSTNGEYELIVTDEAGNETNVMFELKQSDYIYVDNGSGTVMITGYRGTDTRLEIPNTLDGKTVTAIGDYAFSEKSLEHVTLPDSVTSIGAHAFYQNVLQVIEVPSSVTTIGKHAFDGNHLASVALSEGLETIGENAFLSNTLTELTIPESVQSIGAGAFQHNPIQEFTVLSNEVALDQKVLHDQYPENPELVMIRGYCGSTANELANYWGYSFKQLEANECLAITLTPSVTELTNEEITVSIDVISAIANVVELKWAKGEQILTYFRDGNGNDVTDNQFTVSENGTYTAYVKDKSGNEKVEQIKIGNIDNSLLIIHVQIVDGKTVTIHANSSDSIQQLKQRLQDTEGIAPVNQKMMFDGKVLEDGRTFADYNLPKEAIVQLIVLSTDASLKQLGVALKDERAIELDLTQLDHDIGKTEQENIEIFATTNDSKAKVTLNGASFDKKQSLQLNVGENTFTMIVTAENGHEQTYTIKVNRQTKASSPGGGGGVYIPSSDISLDQLEVIIDGENRLPFDPAQFEYDLGDTEAETAEIIVKAHHPRATITLDGEVFTDKKALLLNEDKNIFNIVIIAENGDEQTYTITVNRLQKVPFIDIAGHWAEGFIKMSYWGDMFYGYPDKTFRPDDRISRMEVTSVLVRLLELDEQKQVPFIDVQSIGKETMEELEKAYANGVVKGYPDQTFKPNTDVTRAHLALILYRTYEKVNGTPYKPKQLTYFPDIADYDQETQHAIAMLVELNIAEGYDWNFMPNEQATRAEAAKMLVRFKEVLGRLERV